MSILFLSHYFPPEGNAPASRVHEMCKRWVRAGHQVTVITGVPNCPTGIVFPGYRNRVWQTETVDGIKVVRVWTFVAANRGKIRRIANYLSFMVMAFLAGMLVKRPDVMVATSPQFFCGWAGTLLSKIRRLRFVLEIRDIWPESISAVGAIRTRLIIRVLEWAEQVMYRSAARIVTVGDGYKRQLIARGVPADKISVITNGVDRELFHAVPASEDLRATYGLAGKFVCAYIGTIGMAARLEVVLRAAAELKRRGRDDIRFMLVGDGADREKLEAQARAEQLDNVVFTGFQDKQRMPAFLASVDACLVHLKRQKLFESVLPSKLFEAAAMGKPVILGVRGCAAEFLEQAGGGIPIEPENAEQLVAAVEQLAQDPELCRRMGRSARAHVLTHYDRDELSATYAEILHETWSTGSEAVATAAPSVAKVHR